MVDWLIGRLPGREASRQSSRQTMSCKGSSNSDVQRTLYIIIEHTMEDVKSDSDYRMKALPVGSSDWLPDDLIGAGAR